MHDPGVETTDRVAWRGLRGEWDAFFAGLSPTGVVHFIAAGVVLWAYHYYGTGGFFRRYVGPWLGLDAGETATVSYFYWYGCSFVFLMVVPLMVIAANGDSVRDYGLGLGQASIGARTAILCLGFMLAVLVVPLPGLGAVYELEGFQRKYPLFREATRSWGLFAAYELAYAAYFVAWEFFFRGYMLFGLEKVIGRWAVFAQMLPFVLLHFGKPDIEALSSVFGGLVLGWLAWRTRSFWYGVAIHASMAVALDLLVGVPRMTTAQ